MTEPDKVKDKYKKEDKTHNKDCPARKGEPVCICWQHRRYGGTND